MIPKKLIEEAALKYAEDSKYVNEGYNLYKDWAITDYTRGVQFAEEYLKDLAIEFAEWLGKNKYYWWAIPGNWTKTNKPFTTGKTSQELFELFIKEKYANM